MNGTKYVVTYHRKENVRFVSHVDFVRVMNRVLRRARLPIAFSEGFNPHPQMGFALPLSTGVTSSCEMMELTMKEPLSEGDLMRRLNDALPKGFTVVHIQTVPEGQKSPIKGIKEATYLVYGADPVSGEQIDSFLKRDDIIVEKRTKSGVKPTDIKPDIREIAQEDDGLAMRLAAGSEHNLKPETVLMAMALYIDGFSGTFTLLHRKSMG